MGAAINAAAWSRLRLEKPHADLLNVNITRKSNDKADVRTSSGKVWKARESASNTSVTYGAPNWAGILTGKACVVCGMLRRASEMSPLKSIRCCGVPIEPA